MASPRTLIVTSCTGEKNSKPEKQLTLADFMDPQRLREREQELANFACRARDLYTGSQHLQLMEGVRKLREARGEGAVDVLVLSAGYGLISEDRQVVPYEVTFNSMRGSEVDSWARTLRISEKLECAIKDYDLIFFLLGENYLRAAGLPVETRPDQTLVFFASRGSKKYLPLLRAQQVTVALSNQEAKTYRYGLIGLKGFLMKRLLERAAIDPELLPSVYRTPNIVSGLLSDAKKTANPQPLFPELMITRTQAKRGQDRSKEQCIPIPDVPVAPNAHLGMQYFIPETDDRVDPNYDFLTDTHAPNRDPHRDDVYAHEIYDTPNYDGVLVSKVVVENSKTKRKRVQAAGIHAYIRYPGPIMGDCGAFGYIGEDEPPFDTAEILEYYQNLGFDFGVSIDHLIVGPFAVPGVREQRYALTLRNAEEFLKKHQEGDYTFTPIGAVQGWDPESYAAMAQDLIDMGYDYIGIGGMARSQSRQIIEVMTAIRPHLKANTRVHLFGVARIDAIPAFRHLGITSFDSASALRRAWLGSGANYHTESGKMYTAIRVPPVEGHGVRVKRLIEAGVADEAALLQLEANALNALRAFDRNKLDIEQTLDALLAYDELVELPRDGKVDPLAQAKRRKSHERMYRELLEDQPWKRCSCTICETKGIEVIIFRGNNRNRRRGFHNTYVFYRRLRALLQKLERASLPL